MCIACKQLYTLFGFGRWLAWRPPSETESNLSREPKNAEQLQNKNKKISISSKESTINTIFLNHNFNTSFVPSNNEVAFSYLEDSKDDFIKTMTPVEVQDRTNQEVEKNFAKKPKFNTPIVERKVIENIALIVYDFDGGRPPSLTPNSILVVSTSFFS